MLQTAMHQTITAMVECVRQTTTATITVYALPWPGNSLDMNPIEGLRKLLKDKVTSAAKTTTIEMTKRTIATWHYDQEISNIERCYI
jgi:transposase